MRTPPLPADFTHARVCKPFCEKYLTLPKMEKLFALEAIQKGRDFGEVLQMWRESWETAKKTVEKMESDPAEVFADTLALVAYSTYLMGVQDGMGLDLNPTSQQMQEFYSNIVQ